MQLHIAGDEPYELDRAYPTPSTIDRVRDEQDLQRAIETYRFFYPTVSAEGMMNGLREQGVPDNQRLLILAAGPRHVVFTANSDTPYASAAIDLRPLGPVRIEVPAGPFIALVNDHHQRWVLDMGIPGPDAGKGGTYLVLPPGFTGDIPAGYHVGRSETFKITIAVRAMPIDGDARGAREALQRVKVSPLSDPSAVIPYADFSEKRIDATPLRWENNLEYWRKLHEVIDLEPVLDEFRPMYGALAALGIEKGKPFAPDARMQLILETAAKLALDQMRVAGFASDRPDRIVWNDRKWEWVGLVPDDANFETKHYLDLEARDRWFVQAIVSSPAMFRRKVGVGSVYFLGARDATGEFLDGGRTYKLVIPQPVPARLFWSVTAYDAQTRSQVQATQDRAVLGSLHDTFEPTADGSIEIYFGPSAPKGHEKQWIQTVPKAGYFLYFRIYGPDTASLDGTWRLGDLARI